MIIFSVFAPLVRHVLGIALVLFLLKINCVKVYIMVHACCCLADCHSLKFALVHVYMYLTDCIGQYYGYNCSLSCDCGSHGHCDSSYGCICDDGWGGIDCHIGEYKNYIRVLSRILNLERKPLGGGRRKGCVS